MNLPQYTQNRINTVFQNPSGMARVPGKSFSLGQASGQLETVAIPGSLACDHTLPRRLRAPSATLNPWTLQDVPEDIVGSWWNWPSNWEGSQHRHPGQILDYNPRTGEVLLDYPTSTSGLYILELLGSYERVPTPNTYDNE
jgi:hypothetical protein